MAFSKDKFKVAQAQTVPAGTYTYLTGPWPPNTSQDEVTNGPGTGDPIQYVGGKTPTSTLPDANYAAATTAVAGSPGSFTPAGSARPANLGALAALTASPATLWTEGQHVVLGDDSKAHWDGDSFEEGEAPGE